MSIADIVGGIVNTAATFVGGPVNVSAGNQGGRTAPLTTHEKKRREMRKEMRSVINKHATRWEKLKHGTLRLLSPFDKEAYRRHVKHLHAKINNRESNHTNKHKSSITTGGSHKHSLRF